MRIDQGGPLPGTLDAVLTEARRRSIVMGILNVTPDSFSDGGRFEAADQAVARARAMVAQGAAIIDVGGESTRPGFVPVSAEEEWRRIGAVVERLGATLDVPLSVDTTKSVIARRALALGASMINDIWGLQGDPAMADVAAASGAAVVVMHNRHEKDAAIDIVDDIRRFFDRSIAIAERAGLPRQRLVLDPGIGFGKTPDQQLQVIGAVSRLLDYGLPVLMGLSRKSFLGRLTGAAEGDRLIETVAANLVAMQAGARIFRVHDVADHITALKVADAIRDAARS